MEDIAKKGVGRWMDRIPAPPFWIPSRRNLPARLVEASRRCHPEGIGRPSGYNFLAVINDPQHKHHNEAREWIALDPSLVDTDALKAMSSKALVPETPSKRPRVNKPAPRRGIRWTRARPSLHRRILNREPDDVQQTEDQHNIQAYLGRLDHWQQLVASLTAPSLSEMKVHARSNVFRWHELNGQTFKILSPGNLQLRMRRAHAADIR